MRTIDADALKQTFCAECARTQCEDCDIDYHFEHLAPTVDAVEVVRCKDCKFNYANQIPSDDACQLCVELPISKDFYCAYGETTDLTPPKRMCIKEGIMCELATEFGYCKITGCVHRTINYSVQDGGKDETL